VLRSKQTVVATVHKLTGEVAGCDTYVVEDESTAVIDPGMEPRSVTKFLDENELALDYVLLTHVHYDHSAAAKDLRETGAEVCVHEAEADALENGDALTLHSMFGSPPSPCPVDRRLEKGDEVAGFEVLHSPGHSPGSACYVSGTKLRTAGSGEEVATGAFVGDLVFPGGSFGRTDLPGGNPKKLVESLERAAELNLDRFYSGHGGDGGWSEVEKAAKLAGAMV